MKIRNLKRKAGEAVVSIWPPVGGAWGVLKSVERLGDGLSLTIEYKGREHSGILQWVAPPSLGEIEKVLKAHLGEPLKAIGDLDV